MHRRLLAAVAVASLSFGFVEAARAAVATFDFEGAAATTGLTTLSQSNNGLTLTVTRPGSSFDVFATSSGFPPSFGTRSLSPFGDTGNTPFILNFSSLISALSVQLGDFFADSDTASLALYSGLNGTGTLLGTTSASYPGTQGFPNDVLTLSASAGAQSARLIGGSASFPNSVYYDNIVATFGTTVPVPEPASFAVLGMGLLGLMAVRRRASS